MHTRRVFLKNLLGFGALLLPWSPLPQALSQTLSDLTGGTQAGVILPPPPPPVAPSVVGKEILNRTALEDIAALADPLMQGREAGAKGEIQASAYLSKQMSALGLQPRGDLGAGYAHTFTIPALHKQFVQGRLTFTLGSADNLRVPSANLLGVLPGQTEELLILCAHYDHLGVYQGNLYPGANDNASGVACVLSVVRRLLRENRLLHHTLLIAFWSAEESGFNGSQAFIAHPSAPLSAIRAVLNIDTVGNGTTGDFRLWGGDNLTSRALRQAGAALNFGALPDDTSGHNSDQLSFTRAGIPAATLLAREWLTKNHTPEDTLDIISPEQISAAEELVYQALLLLDQGI
ncbi:MAG: M20/M25/M40 family metallo-hydrolase [Peptococcaceae bacterium]|jgi:hypothetical protein|nr:M20/M25/M40 family metallo-hydrolase [Peptococcaceae bacterium]